MFTVRELPREEWHRLTGTESAAVADAPPTMEAVPVVVEDEAGEIVGVWTLMTIHHLEGLWIHPAHRGKTSVWRRLITTMRAVALARGVFSVWSAALDEGLAQMALTRGAHEIPPMRHFVIPVRRMPSCR